MIYTVDDSASQDRHGDQSVYVGCDRLARAGYKPPRNTRFFAHFAQYRANWFLSRQLLLYRGAYARHLGGAVSPFLPGLPFIGAVVVGGSAASNPMAQIALAGSNNGSNLDLHRNLFTYEDQMAWTHGRQQIKFGAWFQRFQSNENIALSQYGQATFPNLSDFLEGTFNTVAIVAGVKTTTASGSFLIDPASTPLSWRSLFSAIYAEDVIRVSSRFTLSLGVRAESSTGWNEAYGRAANYTFTNGVINTQPQIGNNLFTVNNSWFLPQPRIGLAWSPFGRKMVIRAGAGIYNDLQDALGYRTDQDAPFLTPPTPSPI